jgi:hypothetical protein
VTGDLHEENPERKEVTMWSLNETGLKTYALSTTAYLKKVVKDKLL